MKFEKEDLRSAVAPGSYCVQVRHVEQRESLNRNPVVEVGLEIVEGECSGAWLRDYFVIGGKNEKAAAIGKRRLARLCTLCGLEIAADVEIDLQMIVGRSVIAEVCESNYQGRPVPRVRAYRSFGGASPF